MKHLIALLFCASLMWGQTSGITTSGNLRSGSGSPEGSVTAPVGTMYQRTDGSTGTALYIKESGSGNTGWVAVAPGAGGSGTFQSTITDLKATRSTHTNANDLLTIAAGRCMGTDKSAATIRITAGSGSGSYAAYCTDSQTLVVEHSTSAGLTVTASGLTPLQLTTPAIPDGMVPIATGTITSGAWDAPTDARDWALGGQRHTNGAGMAVECSGGSCVHAVDTAQVWVQGNTLAPAAGVDFTGATITEPFRETTSDPGTCSGTEVWRRTDTGDLKHCVGGVATVIGGGTTVAKNGVYLRIGSTDYLMPGMYQVTAPTTSGYSWLENQGGASASTTSTGGALKLTLTTGTSGFRVYGKTLSGATRVTAVIASPTWSDSGSAISFVGVGFRESGTGRLQMLRVQANQATPNEIAASNFTGPGAFSSNLNYAPFTLSAGLLYLQAEITGGSQVYRVSTDGTNWMQVASEATGSFLTPDELWVGGSVGSSEAQVLVYSLLVE